MSGVVDTLLGKYQSAGQAWVGTFKSAANVHILDFGDDLAVVDVHFAWQSNARIDGRFLRSFAALLCSPGSSSGF